MKRLLPLGRILFAIGLLGFGALHLLMGDFLAGRAPAWPESLPGRLAWAWLSGILLIAAGVAIIAGKRPRLATELAAAMIFAWALLRLVPVATAAPAFGGEWTMLGKALVFSGGALAIAATFPTETLKRASILEPFLNGRATFILLGSWCLGLFMTLCGIQHFIHVKFVATLVPAWIPGAYFWTYITGVALVAGGIGLLIPKTARLAALLSGAMVFAWVLLLHIPLAVSKYQTTGTLIEWLAVFEATAVSGLALTLARAHPSR